jgi:probable rRNA maturation factor
VLSFPQQGAGGAVLPRLLGDVAISLETARRQARLGGWTLAAELRRLLAHGLLHCLGHDHEHPGEARRMAAWERRLLGRDGMVGESLATSKSGAPRTRFSATRHRKGGRASKRSRSP